MPGARKQKIVTSKLIAVRIVETLASRSPMNHRSWPAPVPYDLGERRVRGPSGGCRAAVSGDTAKDR